MNEGIKFAAGEIIMHLHSDDYLAHPAVLSRVANRFDNPACEWLFGRTLMDNAGGWTPEAPHFPQYSYSRLLQGNIIPHPATFIRRRLFHRFGLYDEELRYAMDYDMWLRVGKIVQPVQIREFLSVFRNHAGSTTWSNRIDSLTEEHYVRRKYVKPFSISRIMHEIRYIKRKYQLQRLI